MILLIVIWATSSGDPVAILINYGGLVGAFALLIIGRLHTTGEVNALNARILALEKTVVDRDETIKAKDAILEAFQFQLTNRTVPALTRTSEVLEAIPQSESALAALLRQSLEQTAILTERIGLITGQGNRDDPDDDDRG